MRDPVETLEEMNLLLDELRTRPEDCFILVEGRKDREALAALGIDGGVVLVQGAGTLFSIAEDLAAKNLGAIILTDWDRKGGQLAQLLRNALKANGVPDHDSIRTRMSQMSKKEIKDIESLPSFLEYLTRRKQEAR